ncbi:MAG: oxidoreductase [Chloroflexota bacterium]|nr:MAG: oxidoreductase [Chloroflexota bacterium]
MTEKFRAIVAEETDGKVKGSLKTLSLEELPDEDVLVDVAYSSLNYKDALAVTGKGKICRRLPMVCGIDLAGTVIESRSPEFKPGDRVLVNGWELSEFYWGGYSQKQRVKPEFLLRVPETLSLEQSMGIGTAGYTAALCTLALQDHGVKPGDGEVAVTGAAGGVGSFAVALLGALGYTVIASTGRQETHDYLRSLGASGFIGRDELARKSKPLESERWAGAVDTVGSQTLATVIAQLRYEGTVAACGLAGGAELSTTVHPFILRGVTLAGINSVLTSHARRQRAWDLLAKNIDPDKLARIYTVEPMTRVPELAEQLLSGRIRGRVAIDVNR